MRMLRSPLIASVAGALLLLAAPPSRAAEILSTDLGEGGPHLEMSLGAYVQPRFTLVPDDEENGATGQVGFSVRRARLEWSARLSRELKPGVDLSVSPVVSVELMPEPVLKDAFAQVAVGRALEVRAGQFKAPVSRTNLASDRRMLFPERAMLASFVPERDLGFQVGGSLGGRRQVEFAAGAFNGEGTNRLANVNRKFLYAARVVVSPLGGPGTGTELVADDKPGEPHRVAFSLGYSIHQNTRGAEGQEEAALGHVAEAFFHYRWVTAQGEFLYRRVDFQATDVVDYDQTGWYAQVGTFLPGVPWAQDHVALLFRVEQADAYVPAEDVPLAGPTDAAQGQRNVSFGAGFYSGGPLFKAIHDLRVTVTYSLRQELEGQDYDNDELMVAAHLAI